MDHYLFTARSITHAQSMAKALERSGINVRVRRVGNGVTQNGCGYTLEVADRHFSAASDLLRAAGQHPVKAFHVVNGVKSEVVL